MKLFIKNQTEDFIGDVKFDPEIIVEDGLSSDELQLVIHDYSKDSAVLKSKGSSSSVLIRLIGKDVKDERKLEGLAKYLTDRVKAGMVSYQQMVMYIVPSSAERPVQCSSSASSSLVCLCPVKLIKDQAAIASLVSVASSNGGQPKSSAAPTSSSGAPQPYVKSAPASSLGYNFLSSLANQVS